MKKIYFAIGHEPLEEFVKRHLKNEYRFVGATVYKEGIVKGVAENKPNIIIIRETLAGSVDILDVLFELRDKFPDTRIILLAGKREVGDNFLAKVVSLGIWDVLFGKSIKTGDMKHLIRNPNQYKNVKHLQNMANLNNPLEVNPKLKNRNPKNTSNINLKKEVSEDSPTEESTATVEPQDNKKEKEKEKKHEDETVKKDNNIGDFFSKMKKSFLTSKTKDKRVDSKQVISFLGSKGGVGNTTIAYNVAVNLANKGYKTIFLELNPKNPSVSYWLNIGKIKDGIDSSITGIEDDNFNKINEAIITSEELKNKENHDMINAFLKLPEKLDFMFYSDEYLNRFKDEESIKIYDFSLIKELILYLNFQKSYDFIIVDLNSNMDAEATKSALRYSNKLITTINQDISSIGYLQETLSYLKKNGFEVVEDTTYIVNKFVKSHFKEKHIEDWLQSSKVLYIPESSQVLIDANLSGVPFIINYSKSKIAEAIFNVSRELLEK